MAQRKYSVMLTSQDRFVAEMAVAASGSLSLLGHNITVVGRGEERGLVRRELITTRRNQKIKEVSYDVKNNYELVKTPVGKPDSDSIDSSSEEDQVRRSSRSRARQKRRKVDLKSRRKRRKDDPPAQVPDQLIASQNIKLETADEENNEMESTVALLLKVEPVIKVEDRELDYGSQQEQFQEFQEFFSVQEEQPGEQMDQEEANELLGFLSGPQEKSAEDILWENVLGEEGGEERQLQEVQEVGSEAGSEPGLENPVSDHDLSIISEFNMLS